LTSKEATLLDYSEEGRALLSQQSSVPLEGFATHAVDASIAEFMKDAKNEVEKGHLYLLWHLLYVEEVLEDVAENAILMVHMIVELTHIWWILQKKELGYFNQSMVRLTL